jgi:peptide/nickel transport system permease protein
VLGYALRRLAWMPPTLIGITLLVFLAVRAAPGDPATIMAGSDVPGEMLQGPAFQQSVARFRERHLLDAPLWRQYLHFLGPFHMGPEGHALFGGSGADPWHGLLVLDLGSELHRPSVGVMGEIGRRLRVTVPLALVSVLLSYAIAIPLGIWSSLRRGTRRDGALAIALFGLHSLPTFWAGLMLILLFGAAGLDWLPSLGLHSKDASQLGTLARVWDLALHCVLPVATLTFGSLAYLSRQMRAGLLEVLPSEYVRAARAKGLSERRALLRHALPNALLPVLTLSASVLPAMVGGSIVVETIFDLPGMGRYAYEGFSARDYNVVMATATVSAVMTLLGLFLADLSYAWADPRIRHG